MVAEINTFILLCSLILNKYLYKLQQKSKIDTESFFIVLLYELHMKKNYDMPFKNTKNEVI